MYLVVNIICTLLYVAAAIYYLEVINISERKWAKVSSSVSFEEEDDADEAYRDEFERALRGTRLQIILSLVINIAWTAFLAVFECNLRRWNRQKAGGSRIGQLRYY